MRLFTAAALLICAVVQNPAPHQKAERSHHQTPGSNSSQYIHPSSSDVPGKPFTEITSNTYAPSEQNKAAQADQRWWQRPSFTDWVMAVTTFAYVVITVFILLAIKRESEIARDAADSAKSSADALINSERAWVIAKISRPERAHTVHEYILSLLNHGKTPARIERLTFDVSYPATFDELRVYGPDDGAELPLLLAPNEPWRFGTYNPSFVATMEGWNDVYTGKAMMVVLGIVVYGDVFQPNTHYTKCCFVYNVKEGCFLMDGPTGFNNYT
jgi:hypothetical protein